jgi:hypothetical protein
MMTLVRWVAIARVFLLPVSLPVRSRFYSRFQIQLKRTPSQCWEMKALDRQGDSSLCHTLSSFIALFLGGSSKLRVAGSIPAGRTIFSAN